MPSVSTYDSRSRLSTDPLRNFKFLVDMHDDNLANRSLENRGPVQLGFMSVSGLSATVETIPYREGGDNTTPRKMPGQGNFSDITLSRGFVLGSTRNFARFRAVMAAIQGRGSARPGNNFRFTIDIHVLHHPINYAGMRQFPKMTFRVYNAWVNSLAFSDLDAGANAVLVEQMTLANEGWYLKSTRSAGTGTSNTGLPS